tara:strand:- start:1518 stop:1820 length:303 start_codon:yes stop_codon:yes gene_type:complete
LPQDYSVAEDVYKITNKETIMTIKANTIEIHNVGTLVALTESVDAKIMTIAIHENNSVTYECGWWNGDTRTKDWFSASDFLSVGEKDAVTKIGFIRNKNE